MNKKEFTCGLFMAIISICLFSCSSDDNNSDTVADTLYQITIKEHEKKFGEISSYGELYEEYTYNDNGTLAHKLTNHIVRSDIGRVQYDTYYMYDELNRMISKREDVLWSCQNVYKYTYNNIDSIATMHVYDDDGKLTELWEYTYDNQNRLLQAKQTYNRFVAYVDDYSYENNIVKIVRHQIDSGELFGTRQYEYDKYNNLTKYIWINGDTGKESVEKFIEYTYDEFGKILTKTIHDYWDKSDLTIYTYTYNPDNTIDKIRISYSYKDDESELRYIYTYK